MEKTTVYIEICIKGIIFTVSIKIYISAPDNFFQTIGTVLIKIWVNHYQPYLLLPGKHLKTRNNFVTLQIWCNAVFYDVFWLNTIYLFWLFSWCLCVSFSRGPNVLFVSYLVNKKWEFIIKRYGNKWQQLSCRV